MNAHRGFTLIEIMVGLVVGMLGMIVILQVFNEFEGRKRTTTTGADAQSNGAIALYMMERDIKMSGWGLDAAVYSTCNTATTYAYCDGDVSCGGINGVARGLTVASFAAVQVKDGGDGPDSITAQYYSEPRDPVSAGTVQSYQFSGTKISEGMGHKDEPIVVDNVYGCNKGGMVLVSDGGGRCTFKKITNSPTDTDDAAYGKILVAQGANHHFNPPVSFQQTNNWPIYSPKTKLACLGGLPGGSALSRTYQIDGARLIRSDNTGPVAVDKEIVASSIIDMKVQYGIAELPPDDQVVKDNWQDATGIWANPSPSDWKRIKAVRVAMIARSAQNERKPDETECTATTDAMVASFWPNWANFKTTNTDVYGADWKCYRYKVFESVIPLRNIIWGKV